MCAKVNPFISNRPGIRRLGFAQQSEEIKWVPLNGAIRQLDGILSFAGLIITMRITTHRETGWKYTSSLDDYGFLAFVSVFGGKFTSHFTRMAIRLLQRVLLKYYTQSEY